jgi:hypothetical protein
VDRAEDGPGYRSNDDKGLIEDILDSLFGGEEEAPPAPPPPRAPPPGFGPRHQSSNDGAPGDEVPSEDIARVGEPAGDVPVIP